MTNLTTILSENANDYSHIRQMAQEAARSLEGPADNWMFRPFIEFGSRIEPYINKTEGDLKLCLALLSLAIKDVTQNLSGDVPYEKDLDIARSNVQRAFRVAFESLANDLGEQHGFLSTMKSCANLVGEYLSTVSSINEKGGF
jgi:hypothetical protein